MPGNIPPEQTSPKKPWDPRRSLRAGGLQVPRALHVGGRWGPDATKTMEVPLLIDVWCHGTSNSSGWFGGSPISGNLHISRISYSLSISCVCVYLLWCSIYHVLAYYSIYIYCWYLMISVELLVAMATEHVHVELNLYKLEVFGRSIAIDRLADSMLHGIVILCRIFFCPGWPVGPSLYTMHVKWLTDIWVENTWNQLDNILKENMFQPLSQQVFHGLQWDVLGLFEHWETPKPRFSQQKSAPNKAILQAHCHMSEPCVTINYRFKRVFFHKLWWL